VSVDARRLSKWLDGFADRHGPIVAELDGDQVSLRAADGSRAWIEVPFPPLAVVAGRVVTSLLVHAAVARRVGVLLVRRGGYAAGVFHGRELISSKVGSSYVQGTTKAGGWSQQRYARRRGNQAKAAFAEAADVAVRILLPEKDDLDQLVLGGDRAGSAAALEDVRLAPLVQLPRGRFLAGPDPRLRVLQATPDQFLSVQIRLLP
jgi:hypothetical protein